MSKDPTRKDNLLFEQIANLVNEEIIKNASKPMPYQPKKGGYTGTWECSKSVAIVHKNEYVFNF